MDRSQGLTARTFIDAALIPAAQLDDIPELTSAVIHYLNAAWNLINDALDEPDQQPSR